MKLNKKILFSTPIIFAAIFFLSAFLLKIYFSFNFDEKTLKQTINQLCHVKLDKAVRFDDISIDFKGDIVLNNFNISMTNDFNDNISLLYSRKAIFKLKFFELFKHNIHIKGVEFTDPVISLHKKFGKSYNENFKKLKGMISKIRKINANSEDLSIFFNNASLIYHEVFKNTDLSFEANRIDCTLILKEDRTCYELAGLIKPAGTKKIKFGTVKLKGCVYENKKEISDNKIFMENFDLSYLNELFTNYDICNLNMNGGLSTELVLKQETSGLSFTGNIRTNNMKLIRLSDPPYSLFKNGNLNIEVDGLFSSNYRKLIIDKLEIKDDILHIAALGEYNDSSSKNDFKLKIKSSDINLSELTGYFTPVRDISYSGNLKFSTDIYYDFRQNSAFKMNSEIDLKDISVSCYTSTGKKNIISQMNGNLSLKKDKLGISMDVKTPDSDFLVKSSTNIKKWLPLTSETEFNLQSSSVAFGLLAGMSGKFIGYLVDEGYKDLKKGYEELFFLKKPIGQLTINNNITFKYTADTINFGEKANLTNFLLKTELKNGMLKLNEFNLQGYGASYSMKIESFLKKDYPHFSGKIRAFGFDLEKFSNDLNSGIAFGGKGSFELNYDLNFYRISHFVQNAKAQLQINISNGYFRNSPFQLRVNNYLQRTGYEDIDLSNVEFSNFKITVNEIGQYFTFSPISITSPTIDFNSFGRYNYTDGIKMTIFASLRDNNRRTVRIPFSVKGPLQNPKAAIRYRKGAGEFSFFNIN